MKLFCFRTNMISNQYRLVVAPDGRLKGETRETIKPFFFCFPNSRFIGLSKTKWHMHSKDRRIGEHVRVYTHLLTYDVVCFKQNSLPKSFSLWCIKLLVLLPLNMHTLILNLRQYGRSDSVIDCQILVVNLFWYLHFWLSSIVLPCN